MATNRLRGTKGGQRGLEYLLTPADYILAQRPNDDDLGKALNVIRFYTVNKDQGRAWRSFASGIERVNFKPPGGFDDTEYVYDRVIYGNEDLLRECAAVMIKSIFGVDYKNPPEEPTPPPFTPQPGHHGMPPGFGPGVYVPGASPFQRPFNYPQGAAFAAGAGAPPHFSYGPRPVPYMDKLDLRAPFNETVPYEQKRALAKYLGLQIAPMVDSWQAIEKDFGFPEVPYYADPNNRS